MGETGEVINVSENKVPQPIGEVVIGLQDPRQLSAQNFHNNPEILYHGSAEPINFSPNYDYEMKIVPHSSKAGAGFYTTPDKEDARLFSIAWGAQEGKEVVTSFLPYQAKMYDFRNRADIGSNAPVPRELFDEYRHFIINTFTAKYPAVPSGYDPYYRSFKEYRSKLNELYFAGKPIDLRQMLSLTGETAHSEFGALHINKFMRQKGFDGLIYLEGGDHRNHRIPASYLFFNLHKLGTYESWHKIT